MTTAILLTLLTAVITIAADRIEHHVRRRRNEAAAKLSDAERNAIQSLANIVTGAIGSSQVFKHNARGNHLNPKQGDKVPTYRRIDKSMAGQMARDSAIKIVSHAVASGGVKKALKDADIAFKIENIPGLIEYVYRGTKDLHIDPVALTRGFLGK